MNALPESSKVSATTNFFIWLATLLVVAFYLLSTAGWVGATIMSMNGEFGEAGINLLASLGPIDHLIRGLQVMVVCVASLSLLIRRKVAFYLFSLTFVLSVAFALFGLQWVVSYLVPVTTLISFVFSWLLLRQGVLK